jgi:hypothetical protein
MVADGRRAYPETEDYVVVMVPIDLMRLIA